MDRESLLKFVHYGFYTVLVCGLLYILIPMDLPELRPSIIQIVLQQLTILMVVALFLERALEVYKLSYFSQEKERLIAKVEQHHLELESLLANPENTSDQKAIDALKLRLLSVEESLRVYKNHLRQNLLRIAVGFGLLIGLTGVRSLETVFSFPVPGSVFDFFRLYLFRLLDLLLTAGLIAGGSEGIHSIIKKLSKLVSDLPQKIIELAQNIKQQSI